MRVLHVVSVDKENYYLNNLADHSDPNEVVYSFVTLASKDCDFVRDLENRGRSVYALDCMRRAQYPQAYRSLRRLYKELNPNIVHTHLFDASLIGLTAAKWQNRKTVLTRHHSDAIHQIPSQFRRRVYLGLEKCISNYSDHIIAPSQTVRRILVFNEGVDSRKVSIIPYGQTTERFDAVKPEKIAAVRAELGMGEELSLVCVSRLFNRKGHVYLFEALSSMFGDGLKARLYLVGDGEYQNVLEQKAAEFGISENVRFLGWRDDALTIVAASDIVVHPSLEDALSSAVIEAIMLEKPIVATDISGVRDSLENGKFGEIVPPADAAGFREGLVKVIDGIDGAKARAMEGRKFLLDYMDARKVAAEHVEIYRELMNSDK